MERKKCSRCQEYKPLRLFYKKSRNGKERQAYCKACCKAYKREKNATHEGNIEYGRSDKLYIIHDRYKRLYFGESFEAELAKSYPWKTNEKLAEKYGCSVATIVRRAKRQGLHKDKSYLKATAMHATFYRKLAAARRRREKLV